MVERTIYAENIRKLRKKMRITQEAIAARLGIKRSTFARYETDTVPPASIIVALSEIFGVSIDEICKGTGDYTDMIASAKMPTILKSPISYNIDSDDESNTQELTEEEIYFINRLRELTPEERNAIIQQLK